MTDEIGIKVVLLWRREFEHDHLTRGQFVEVLEDGRSKQRFDLRLFRAVNIPSGSMIGTKPAAMIWRATSNCWLTMSLMQGELKWPTSTGTKKRSKLPSWSIVSSASEEIDGQTQHGVEFSER
jgi:hypothetical protein